MKIEEQKQSQNPTATAIQEAQTEKRARRTSTELFFDAAKEHKDKIANLKAQLAKAEEDHAAFVEQAKKALEI